MRESDSEKSGPANDISREAVENFIYQSISGGIPIVEQKAFLMGLNEKGFTGDEVAHFVKAFYEKMPARLELPGAIDICGTGGSCLPRINTSTISAFILSACGVQIAKHGNKAASGRFGSFDLLEELGVDITLDKHQLESIYKEKKLAFIFARSFHPAFRHFAQARQELGVKTIFNILGPLINPANPDAQVIGTSDQENMKLITEASKILGKKHVLVLNGADGLDEFTLTGQTNIMELGNGEIRSYSLSPNDFGIKEVPFAEIAGRDRAFNIRIAYEILSGKCETQHQNLVLANCALILKFMDKAVSYKEGMDMARQVIANGRAHQALESYKNLSRTGSEKSGPAGLAIHSDGKMEHGDKHVLKILDLGHIFQKKSEVEKIVAEDIESAPENVAMILRASLAKFFNGDFDNAHRSFSVNRQVSGLRFNIMMALRGMETDGQKDSNQEVERINNFQPGGY